MAASATSRPLNGRINVHEPSDYPIVLGDSLKNDDSLESQYISFRYNWEPRNGFVNQKGLLKRASGKSQLVYRDKDSESLMYDYDAVTAKDESESNDASTSRLALVFDPKRSAYVLEQISHTYDLNLASAHDQSKEQVRQHRRISASDSENDKSKNPAQRSTERNGDEADPSNPFDFRNFMSEAKEVAEKAALPTGGRTPIPGSRTPLSGISSPSLPPGRFLSANATQFRPAPTSAPAPIPTSAPKKTPVSKSTPSSAAVTKKQPAAKRKPATTKQTASKPISNEIVTDSSDDEPAVTTNRSRPSMSQPEERDSKRKDSFVSRSHSPTAEQDDGGLVIDFGSPPRETMPKRTIDLEAFRSQTHTPIMGLSSNKPAPRSYKDPETDQSDDEMEQDDYSYHHDQDKTNHDEDDDIDMDEDVEALALPSPHSKKMEEIENIEKAPSPPTPLPPHLPDEVDDVDDDFLAAELEAALGEGGEDDESEVSEEE